MYLIGGFNGRELVDIETVPLGKQVQAHKFPSMHNKRGSFGMYYFVECVLVGGGLHQTLNFRINAKFTVLNLANGLKFYTRRCQFTLTYFQGKVWAVGGLDISNMIW